MTVGSRKYLNEETFYGLDPVEDIKKDMLLALDHYAFHIDELVDFAQVEGVAKLLINPHTEKRFSKAAIDKMLDHPNLSKYVKEALEEDIAAQEVHFTDATINAVIDFLNKLHSDGVDGSVSAQAKFLVYKESLSKAQRNTLENYIIEMLCIHGGCERMRFQDAFNGGASFSPCIWTTQRFLWQFVVIFRPDKERHIPDAVKKNVAKFHLKFGKPTEHYRAHDQHIQDDFETFVVVESTNGLFAVLTMLRAMQRLTDQFGLQAGMHAFTQEFMDDDPSSDESDQSETSEDASSEEENEGLGGNLLGKNSLRPF